MSNDFCIFLRKILSSYNIKNILLTSCSNNQYDCLLSHLIKGFQDIETFPNKIIYLELNKPKYEQNKNKFGHFEYIEFVNTLSLLDEKEIYYCNSNNIQTNYFQNNKINYNNFDLIILWSNSYIQELNFIKNSIPQTDENIMNTIFVVKNHSSFEVSTKLSKLFEDCTALVFKL